MAESTLSLTRDDVRARVSMMLGYGFGINDADSEELERVDLFLNAGLRRFLNPVTEEGTYDWTFLYPTATYALVAGTQIYNLPDDCMGYLNNDLVITAGGAGTKVTLISLQQLLQKEASEGAANGRPDYAATRVRNVAPTTSAGQRTELLVYPTPDVVYTLTYSYNVQANAAASNTFLFGGQHHSETIVAAVMAEAERYSKVGVDGPPETKWETAYQERLAASVAIDKKIRGRELAMSFPVTDPTYGTYQWLQRGIGKAAQYGADFNTWDHAQERHVDDVIQRGLQQFYTPPPQPGGEGEQPVGHKWSFLRPTANLSFAASTDEYTLPPDFRSMSGEMSYVSGSGKRSLRKVTEEEIRSLISVDGTSTATPRYYAVRPIQTDSVAAQKREIVVYPSPNAAFTVTYRYSVEPKLLTPVANYPYGGVTHADTILASCLAKLHEDNEQYQQSFSVFMQRLAASIDVDREVDKAESTASPETSPVYGTYQWLQRGLGNRAGYGWDSSTWSYEEERQIDYAIQRGLQQFYVHPPAGEGPPHHWSFLRISATHTVAASDDAYDLPADFREVHGAVTFASGTDKRPLKKIGEDEYRTLLASQAESGDPLYYAIRSKTTAQTSAQLREMLLYPNPTAAGTLTYRYTAEPAALTTSAEYPYGGATHSDTIFASCTAVLFEGREESQESQAMFQQRLAASVAADRMAEEAEAETTPDTKPTYGTYQWLQRTLGRKLQYGPNYNSWSAEQTDYVDEVIQRGLQQFYVHPPVQDSPSHQWTFLKLSATHSVTSGDADHDLPADFRDVHGAVTFAAGTSKVPLKKVPEDEFRSLRAKANDTGDPLYYAIRAKTTSQTATQRREMLLYPEPTGSGTLTYRYRAEPSPLTPAANHPYGGTTHADTILASCIASCMTGEDASEAYGLFMQRLTASVSVDSQVEAMLTETEPDTAPTYATYQWFQRALGRKAGYGPNYNGWSTDNTQHIDEVIQRGLQQFYVHPPVEQEENHHWSFLRIAATHSVTSGDDDYDLPADFREVHGDVTFASGTSKAPLTKVSEDEYRALLAKSNDKGDPLYYAIRAKTTAQTAAQVREMVLYPEPIASGTLTFRYTAEPAVLTTSANYPYGGATHTDTILSSCLAVLQEDKPEAQSSLSLFMQRLASSVVADRNSEDAEAETTPDAKPIYGTYQWFQRTLGRKVKYGPNYNAWSTEQTDYVDEVIQRGLQQFYVHPPVDDDLIHQWTFLKLSATHSVTSGDDDYDLPADFREVHGSVTFAAGTSKVPLKRISEDEYRELLAKTNDTGDPLYYAIRAKATSRTDTQRREMLLYPEPTGTGTLTYRYHAEPAPMTASANYPYGGTTHADTILASCATYCMSGEETAEAFTLFMQRLTASVSVDRQLEKKLTETEPDTAPTYGTYQWFQRILGRKSGYGPNYNGWSTDQTQHIDEVIQRGLQQFYVHPPVEQEENHHWSFLRIAATHSVVGGTDTYALPADFREVHGELDLGAGTSKVPIAKITEDEYRALLAKSNDSGTPLYYAVRAKTTSQSSGQLREMVLYPKPDASFTLTFRYTAEPAVLTTSANYPYGGATHTDTILASCMSVLQEDQPESQASLALFMQRLTSSVVADRNAEEASASTQPNTTPTYGTYQWFQRTLGNRAGYGWNPDSWNTTQERHVDYAIQRGLQQFYVHPPIPDDPSHQWTFLRVTATHTVSSGDDDYDLPADFREVHGDVTFAAGTSKVPLTKITEGEYRSLLSKSNDTGDPLYYAIGAKAASQTSAQRREMFLYPEPTGSGTLTYRYTQEPAPLSTGANYAHGGATHGDTILASCLAVMAEGAEKYEEANASFIQHLTAAVTADRETERAGAETHANTAPTYGTYQWLQRTIGKELEYGPNYNSWSTDQTQNVDEFIQRGLQAFYSPPPMPSKEGFTPPIKWSFLCPTASLTLVDGTATYTLPTDFSDMSGPVSFAVGNTRRSLTKVTEGEIRSQQSVNDKGGDPSVYCVRAKTTASTAEQTKEILVYPTPDAGSAGSVTYRYTIVPAVLTTSAEFPYGGRQHAETIMASCRAIMAEGQEAFSQAYEVFLQRLVASRSVDERVEEPEDQSWPATEPTYGTYQWLQRVLGDESGFGANYDAWSQPQERRIDDIIQRGVQQFYSPPPMPIADGAAEKPPNKWSFLCPTATLTLVASTHTYALPADFSDMNGIVSFAITDTRRSLSKVDEGQIRSLQSTKDTTDDPYVYCVRAKATGNTSEQLKELVVYPTPDAGAAGTVTYRYTVIPKALSPASNYPYGGRSHSDTILASCRAIKAEGTDGYNQAYQVFLQRLAASREVDKRVEEKEASTWLASEPTFGTIDWIQQEMGAALKLGPNPGAWNNDMLQRVKSWLNRGYQEFLKPSLTGNRQHRFHQWSFLYEQKTFTTSAAYSTGTITIASGVVTLSGGVWPTWAADGELDISGAVYTVDTRDSGTQVTLTDLSATADAGTSYSIVRQFYSLDSDVESIDGPMHFRSSSAGYGKVDMMSQQDLQMNRHSFSSTSSGIPRIASLSPSGSTGGTVKRIEFFPRTNAVYELHYRARLAASTLVSGNTPLGGREHAETILAACLAVAEPTRYRDQYAERLGASIELDQQAQAPETLGVNRDNLDRPENWGSRDHSVYGTAYEGVLYD